MANAKPAAKAEDVPMVEYQFRYQDENGVWQTDYERVPLADVYQFEIENGLR